MKKSIKIVSINLAIFFIVYLLLEFLAYKNADDDYPFLFPVSRCNSSTMAEDYNALKGNYWGWGTSQEEFMYRRPVGLQYTKKPIVIFGCSMAWGAGLNEPETFHYKLSELTKRPVYNRAISGWGVQHMLFLLQQDDLYQELPKPEYVVYLYISHHIQRMYKYSFIYNWGRRLSYNYGKYNMFFGKLCEEKRLQHTLFSRLWNHYILKFIAACQEKNEGASFKLLEKHLLECKKQVENRWGNDVKFVILNYECEEPFNDHPNILNKKNINKLSNDGFIVVSTSDLTGIKELGEIYTLKEDIHPNEKAWNLITPLFAKEIDKI